MIGELTHDEFLELCNKYKLLIFNEINRVLKMFGLGQYIEREELWAVAMLGLLVATHKYYKKERDVKWTTSVLKVMSDYLKRHIKSNRYCGIRYMPRKLEMRPEVIRSNDKNQLLDLHTIKCKNQNNYNEFWEDIELFLRSSANSKTNKVTNRSIDCFLMYFKNEDSHTKIIEKYGMKRQTLYDYLYLCKKLIVNNKEFLEKLEDKYLN